MLNACEHAPVPPRTPDLYQLSWPDWRFFATNWYHIQYRYFKVDVKHMKKWAIGVLTSKGGTVRIMILQRGNVTHVNEKIILEGWKSLGRRCVGQGGDSQIYEGDKGVWGCQQATKRGRSLQKCKTLKSWRERKDPNPPRGWLKKVGHKEEADNQILLKIFYQKTKS